MSLDDLKSKRSRLNTNLDSTITNMDRIITETQRVAEVAHNSSIILEDLDAEFEKQTGLNKTDVKFLLFATALQIGRWVVINQVNKHLTDNINSNRMVDDDPRIKKAKREAEDKFKMKHDGKWDHNKSEKYPTWLEIVYTNVPYDVTEGSPKFGVKMEGQYHRIHTLGHDPLLGWIFGTMNIISRTLTTETFRTFVIEKNPVTHRPYWDREISLLDGFARAIESIKEDDKRLPAAIFTQAVHLKSDVYTKNGLPVPLLEKFSPDLAGKLYKSNYDSLLLMKDIAVVGVQAVGSILINMIISLIHGLYYDPNEYSNRDIYEVKTRKILLYSNLISSASNVIWVGANAALGNESAWKDLDIGGIIVTMYRLITDTKFIREVKEEFVFGGFKELIKGEDLGLEVPIWE